MPKVAIISKPMNPELEFILTELVDWLTDNGFTPILGMEGNREFLLHARFA